MSKFVLMFSCLLASSERECVCGDIEELGLSAPAAVANILGLAIRRQLTIWSHGEPWIALLGVAGIAGTFLSEVVGRTETLVSQQITTYLHYGVAYQPGGVTLGQEAAYVAVAVAALTLWSWACGVILAALSGRALWLTTALFYLVVHDSFAVRFALAGELIWKGSAWRELLAWLMPLQPVMLIFLLGLVSGIVFSRRRTLRSGSRFLLSAAGLASVAMVAWMENWFAAGFADWSGRTFVSTPFLLRILPLLAAAWPVFSLPLLRHGSKGSFSS